MGDPPLLVAARKGDAAEVKRLVAAKASLDSREKSFGWGPLHVAAGSGALEAIAALLELRADVGAKASDEETPLHLAAAEGHTAAIKALAAAGADVSAGNEDGETPLHVAVQHVGGKPTLGHIKALLELKADPAKKDGNGHDALASAGLYTNRPDEIRALLSGCPVEGDPEDKWPDDASGLPEGRERTDAAEGLRELGNRRFKEGQYERALKHYAKAKLFLPAPPFSEAAGEELERVRDCFVAASNNAAMCKLKLGDTEACVRMCDTLLTLDASNLKAMCRKAMALRVQGDAKEAEAVLKQGLYIDPKDAGLLKELGEMVRERKKEKEKEKQMAKKIFG